MIVALLKILNVEDAHEDELYSAMDWLLKRQTEIEKKLAGQVCTRDIS